MTRLVLFTLLGIVAASAAVLSFSALRDLALVCGFAQQLAWMLPLVVDAGAAAGSVSWLSQPTPEARRFGCWLAVVLLIASVAGNGVAHLLQAYSLSPPWWLLACVSALAPAVLAATVHLTTITVQGRTGRPETAVGPLGEGTQIVSTPDEVGTAEVVHAAARSIFRDPRNPQVGQVAAGDDLDSAESGAGQILRTSPGVSTTAETTAVVGQAPTNDRAAELIAEGVGRRRLARELDISEHEARQILAGRTNGHGPS